MSIALCNRGGKTDDAKWLMETLRGSDGCLSCLSSLSVSL